MDTVLHTLLSIAVFLPPLRGHAYLDPGSGSFIIQLLIAGLVGAGFLIRVSWKKIIALFSRLFKREDPEPRNDAPR
jgi:hypothetical protein